MTRNFQTTRRWKTETLPTMVTCQNCGHPFPSTVLQLDEDAFKAGNWNKQNDEGKKYSETCPKFKKRFEYYYDNFFWKDQNAH